VGGVNEDCIDTEEVSAEYIREKLVADGDDLLAVHSKAVQAGSQLEGEGLDGFMYAEHTRLFVYDLDFPSRRVGIKGHFETLIPRPLQPSHGFFGNWLILTIGDECIIQIEKDTPEALIPELVQVKRVDAPHVQLWFQKTQSLSTISQ